MNFTVIMLIILTFTSRIIGLGREMTLAYFYGASEISDAYLISLTIPTVILGFIAAGISTGYIPIYRQLELENKEQAFTNQVIHLVLIICGFIFTVSMILTPQIVPLFASGFSPETLELTVKFTRITLFGVFFTGLAHIFQGYLQVKEKVLLASLSGIPFNVVTITFIVISARTHNYVLAIGSAFAVAAQALYLYVLARRSGYGYRRGFRVKDESIRKMVVLALPIILGNSVEQIDRLVDKTIASQFGVGSVTALGFAARTMTAIQGIFIASVLVVFYPKIAEMAAKKDMAGMKESLKEAIVGISLFLFPAIIAIMTFSEPVVNLLFGRGAFDEEAVTVTARILFFYIASLFGSGIQSLLARAFFSLQDAKTPMINATIAIVLNIGFNLLLSRIMGIAGLALANTVATTLAMVLMYVSLHRKVGSLDLKIIFSSLGKIVGAAGVMAVVAVMVFNLVEPWNDNMAFLMAAAVGVVVYGFLILLLKIKEVELLVQPITRKFKSLMG